MTHAHQEVNANIEKARFMRAFLRASEGNRTPEREHLSLNDEVAKSQNTWSEVVCSEPRRMDRE
jgi:hypothetical protein